MTEAPSALVAKNVTDRLVAEGLIRPDVAARLAEKLGAGTLRQDDWRVELDLAAGRERAA